MGERLEGVPHVRDGVATHGSTVAHAGHTVGAVAGLDADLVAVVTARVSDAPTRSAPEVLGVVTPRGLRLLLENDPARAADDVADHAGGPPAAVGAEENLAGALARTDGPVLVLVDGRAVAVVARAALEQGPHPVG